MKVNTKALGAVSLKIRETVKILNRSLSLCII